MPEGMYVNLHFTFPSHLYYAYPLLPIPLLFYPVPHTPFPFTPLLHLLFPLIFVFFHFAFHSFHFLKIIIGSILCFWSHRSDL